MDGFPWSSWPSIVGLDFLTPIDVQFARMIWTIRSFDPRNLGSLLGLPGATPRLDPRSFGLLNGSPIVEMARVPTCPHFQLIEWVAGFVGVGSLVGATRLCGMIEWQEDVTPRGNVLWARALLERRRTPQRACLAVAAALRWSLMLAVELSKNRSEIEEISRDKAIGSLDSKAIQRLAELKAEIEAAERFLGWARIAEAKLKDLGEKKVVRWVYERVYLPLIAQAVGEKEAVCKRAPDLIAAAIDEHFRFRLAAPSWVIEGLD